MIEKYTDPKYIQGFPNIGYDFSDDYKQGYLDGRASIIAELEKIKAEIAVIPTQICLISQDKTARAYRQRSLAEYEKDLFELIDNHISELKGENNE